MAEFKCPDLILDALEEFRRNERQPNLGRVCRMLGRRLGLDRCAASKELENLVNVGSVIEVFSLKDKIYRTASGEQKTEEHCHRGFYVTSYVTSVILDVVRTLTVTKDYSQLKCAYLLDIHQCLGEREINPFTLNTGTLRTVLNREVSKGNLHRLENGGFVLNPRPSADTVFYESSSSSDEDSESSFDDSNTADANRKGTAEEPLKCRDCTEEAHPSCMEDMKYGSIPQPQTWQGPEPKAPACVVCEKSTNLDDMLTCDLCYKSYHKVCHDPAVLCDPTGLWICYDCDTTDNSRESGKNKKFKSHLSSNEYEPPAVSLDDEFSKSIEQYPTAVPKANKWTVENVESFLKFLGFKDEAPKFREQEIDGMSLLLMKRSDVLTGLGIKLGSALKIYNHILKLQSRVANN